MNPAANSRQATDRDRRGRVRPAVAPSSGAFGVRKFLCLTILVLACGCATQPAASTVSPKIMFDLSVLDADGLQGPVDGKRALAYEFCIPARPECRDEVAALDSTVRYHARSPGRIGCGTNQVLCIGSTHQPGFEEVLRDLAALPYVDQIQECFFE